LGCLLSKLCLTACLPFKMASSHGHRFVW
jgi:hypothetical protein